MYQTFLSNAIASKDNLNIKIKTSNHPLPLTIKQKKVSSAVSGFTVVLLAGLGMSFIPTSVIIFIMKERECGMKHQQILSGVSIYS